MQTLRSLTAAATSLAVLAVAAPAIAHQTGEPHVHGVLAELGHMIGHLDFWLVAAGIAALAAGIAFAVIRRRR
jgi:LPXTG-motif cell wall-anchored protein